MTTTSNAAAAQPAKYWAFVSYSSKDAYWGKRVINELEAYRIPRSLIGLTTPRGVVPRRLYPIFRDRDELRAGGDVSSALHSALAESRYLIAICSPNSADPRSWVGKEIAAFKASGRDEEVLALIVDGEPPECFPAPLKHRFDDRGRETDLPYDPLAADVRREDLRPKEAQRKALLKLIAPMIGVKFDDLEQRDRKRRRQRRIAWSAASLALLSVLSTLVYVWLGESRKALSQQLAKQARDESESHPDLALLLGALSYRVAPTAAAYDSVLATLWPRQNLVTYPRLPQKVSALTFAPDDRSLAVAYCLAPGCARSAIARYDLDSLRISGAPVEIAGKVTSMIHERDRLLVGQKDADAYAVFAVDLASSTSAPTQLYRSADPITSLQASGRLFAVGMQSGEFKVFADGAGRRCGGSVSGPVSAMAFSADGRKFAALTERDWALVDLTSSDCATRHEHAGERIATVAFDATADELYVVALDGTIDRWRVAESTADPDEFMLIAANGYVHALDPEARYLASRHDGSVFIFDLSKRRAIEKEIEERGSASPLQEEALRDVAVARLRNVDANGIVFSPSGKLVATVGADGQVVVWSTAERPIVERSSLEHEASSKSTEAVSRDGRFRAEAHDGSEGCGTEASHLCRRWTQLRLIDGDSRLEITRLAGPREMFRSAGPTAVKFQEDGSVAVEGDLWREVWNVAPESLIARACRMANRDLTSPEIEHHLGWREKILRTAQPCAAAAAGAGSTS